MSKRTKPKIAAKLRNPDIIQRDSDEALLAQANAMAEEEATSTAVAIPDANESFHPTLSRSAFQPTGLKLPPNLTKAEYEDIGARLLRAGKAMPWWIGDFLLYKGGTWGETYADAMETYGITYQRAADYKSVAKTYPMKDRRADVDWTHHKLIASLPTPKERRAKLSLVAAQEMSVVDLRQLLKHEEEKAAAALRAAEDAEVVEDDDKSNPPAPIPTYVPSGGDDPRSALKSSIGSVELPDGAEPNEDLAEPAAVDPEAEAIGKLYREGVHSALLMWWEVGRQIIIAKTAGNLGDLTDYLGHHPDDEIRLEDGETRTVREWVAAFADRSKRQDLVGELKRFVETIKVTHNFFEAENAAADAKVEAEEHAPANDDEDLM